MATVNSCEDCGQSFPKAFAACPNCGALAPRIPGIAGRILSLILKTLAAAVLLVGIALMSAVPRVGICLVLLVIAWDIRAIKIRGRSVIAILLREKTTLRTRRRPKLAVLEIVGGLLALTIFGGVLLGAKDEEAKKAEAMRVLQTEQEELARNAPTAAVQLENKVGAARAALAAKDPKKAELLAAEANALVLRYRVLTHPSTEFAGATARTSQDLEKVDGAVNALRVGEQAAKLVEAGKEKLRAKDIIGAEDDFKSAQDAYSTVPTAYAGDARAVYDPRAAARQYAVIKGRADVERKLRAQAEAFNAKQDARTAEKVEAARHLEVSGARIARKFGIWSPLSDLQKEESWKQYQGKDFEWRLRVTDVSSDTFGGFTVQWTCEGSESLIQDVQMHYPEGEKSFVMNLQKGKLYRVKVRLKSSSTLFGMMADPL